MKRVNYLFIILSKSLKSKFDPKQKKKPKLIDTKKTSIELNSYALNSNRQKIQLNAVE